MNKKEFHTDFYMKGQQFLSQALHRLSQEKVDIKPHWTIDHLCYRVESLARYHELKAAISEIGSLLIESDVNGRPIATFQLHKPFEIDNHRIDILELPAPKAGKVVREGFEHFEIVADEPFGKLIQRHPNIQWDASGLQKEFNQELEIKFEDFSIKFHPLSLESVIRLEKNQKVFQALHASDVLKILKDYDPLIAGTFPLGIDVAESDVDVLVFVKDRETLSETIRHNFEKSAGFYFKEMSGLEGNPIIVQFQVQGVPFEIFAQPVPSIQQRAYRHFLVEERILKIGGEKLAGQIRSYRQAGLKTEPAFAKALSLAGDPYEKLLELYSMSHKDLESLVRNSVLS